MTRLPLVLLLLSASAFTSAPAQQFKPPTPEELSMTAQPEVPGASAVYLYREETTDDHLHMFSIYARIKVLTERGKEYANVELPYATSSDGGGMTIDNIQGRTIHADGTIIPFTGKPMQKLVEKVNGRDRDIKFMTKVFSLPDVQVGSIIEYSYQKRMDDHYFSSPDWYIQSELFTRKAHYRWKPTGETLMSNDDRGQLTNTIAWTPILPPGTTVKQTQLPPVGGHDGQLILDLDVANVPPAPKEDLMPPIKSFTYRVLFYYSPYRTMDEYWKNEGKHWAKLRDKFIGPGPGVSAEVARITAPGDTPDQKLHKIYAAVMELENTDLTRERSKTEEKGTGLNPAKNTDDILARKRGSGDQLATLFVAMARAAGMKSYLMVVTNRDRSVFLSSYLSMSQLDDDIAIVNVDGKDQFFDPGTRFCPYSHLAWKHSMTTGVRQVDGGATIANAPAEPYTAARIQRVANLTMNDSGEVTGTVKLTFTGEPALSWRQETVTGDLTSVKRDLKLAAEHMLPGGMQVDLVSMDDPTAYEKPLNVVFNVKGAIGSPTGKRLLVPGDLFETNATPLFPHEKRELPVYFNYGSMTQDAIRINFPSTLTVEALPVPDKQQLDISAVYTLKSEKTPTSVTIRRDYALGQIGFLPADYPKLRTFRSRIEAKDQEPIILTRATTTAAN